MRGNALRPFRARTAPTQAELSRPQGAYRLLRPERREGNGCPGTREQRAGGSARLTSLPLPALPGSCPAVPRAGAPGC
ncbi:hypothetical protein EK904_013106 [Melospiza melodia maxima]|nr:hypothetical protein EK904_013106 [Melospiza melodia maxima]